MLNIPFNTKHDVRPHGKTFHSHCGQTVLVPAAWIILRRGGKLRRIRIGEICPACGFLPNDVYKRANIETLEKLLTG